MPANQDHIQKQKAFAGMARSYGYRSAQYPLTL